LFYAGLAYGGAGYPGLGYYGSGPGGILNNLFNMLPGQAGYAQQTPGMNPGSRFYVYDNVTGSGVLAGGSLPIVSQFAGVAGINYGGYGGYGPNNNSALLPPGVALNVAFNTLPGIPMTQAPMPNTPIGNGFGPLFGFNNPNLLNPLGYNPYLMNPNMANRFPLSANPSKFLGNGGYGL